MSHSNYSFSIGIQAQTQEVNPDQVKLTKQFTGKWKCNLSKDSAEIMEIVPYGKGFEALYIFTAKEKVFFEGRQLWGYDSKYENFICYSLSKNDGLFQSFKGRFTTDKKMYWEGRSIVNPEKQTYKAEFKLKGENIIKSILAIHLLLIGLIQLSE